MQKDYEEFKTRIIALLGERLGDDSLIRTGPVNKLNGQKLDSIYIAREGTEIYPTFYLDHLYEMNRDGMSLEDMVNMLMDMSFPESLPDVRQYAAMEDIDQIRDRICIRVINTEKNRKMLENMPGVPFLDLTAVFYVLYMNGPDSYHTAVTDSLFESWGIGMDEMYSLAWENTKRLNPPKVTELSELLESLCPDMFPENACTPPAPEITVLSSEKGIFGAAYILDASLIAQAAEELDDDVYIIPSSVHEILLIPVHLADREEIDRTVKAVNETALSPGEFLSDHVYLYSRKSGRVEM